MSASANVKCIKQSEEGSVADDVIVDIARDQSRTCITQVAVIGLEAMDQSLYSEGQGEPSCTTTAGAAALTPMPLHFRWIPCCFRYDHGPLEATGLTLDAYARGYILMSSIFLGPALLQLATAAAAAATTVGTACIVTANDDDDVVTASTDATTTTCQVARIYGMKPSSLLSNIAVVTGLLTSCSMPLVGAIVDHTSYRKQLGTYTAYALAMVKAIEAVLLTPTTWFAVASLQVLSGWLFYAHVVATYAYTSELTHDTTQQTKYNTYFFTVLYAATLIYMAKVLTLSYVFQQDDVGTAKISLLITAITSAFMFTLAWSFFFRNRHRQPPFTVDHHHHSSTTTTATSPHHHHHLLYHEHTTTTSSLATMGFYKVWNTTRHIYKTMPALLRIMGSVLFAESAMNAIITIATTYMTTVLDMSSSENGVVFLLVLIMGIPGAKIGEFLALQINPLTSAKLCILLFIISTTLAAIVLQGPHHKQYAKFFGILWGISMGWLHPMHTVLFIGLIPKDNNNDDEHHHNLHQARTEFMGMYIFCQQVLSWLPPLIFTILNELGVSMGIGLASLDIFFLLGLICLQSIGTYDHLMLTMNVPETTTNEDDHHDHIPTNPATAMELPPMT